MLKYVVVSLGANCGNREESVAKAMEWLGGILSYSVCSSIYETPPYGHAGSKYMNAVVAGSYDGSLQELEKKCKDYELANGRDSKAREEGSVPIDIDIVISDGEVMREADFSREFFLIGYREIKK